MKLAAPALLTLALVAGCGGGGDSGGGDFAAKDPQGAKACSALADAFKNKDDVNAAVQGSTDSATAAASATTEAIKAAVIDLAGTKVADPEKMVKACRDAGVDMPDVPSS